MKAHEIMTRNVVTIAPDASIHDAAKLMIEHHVSGLPVVDAAGKLIGIVTERDFLRRQEIGTERQRPRWLEFLRGPGRQAVDFVREAGRKVHEIMTPNVYSVIPDAELADIVDIMERHRIKRVPVVQGERLLGIVSRHNFVVAIADVTRNTADISSSDSLIRRRVLAVLHQQEWVPAGLEVRVKDGVVDIIGFITDEKVRRAIVVAAENVAGVVSVNEHLCWVDPMSGTYFPPDPKQVVTGV
ncbi:CBS domain-containing protein [Tardiphaga alba]|uniref:CBS domain-containing protein n=1 Tax=Tardiphaga alba TaxID=340268 RepID=A0ABX8A316_9BRAD|nr:CBS domain-containing protein [Tardiphaga alba]QUS37903.1 CBS domain-containing protein [Tardiphaga alba]